MHNVGKSYKGTPKYSFVKIPVPADGKDVYDKAEVVGSVPFRWSKNPTYLHSFGMSENYYVLVEQALTVSVLGLMTSRISRETYSDCLKWHATEKQNLFDIDKYPSLSEQNLFRIDKHPSLSQQNVLRIDKCASLPQQNLFRIVDRRTGQEVNPKTPYLADPFFTFHHINTYEEEGHLVVDVSAYPDKKILDTFYLKNVKSEQREVYPEPTIRRYVLPLATYSKATSGQNLVTVKESSASAIKQKNGQVLCDYEKLSDQGLDFPHINDGRLGKKYRYIYGAGGQYINKLVKIDTLTKQSWVWEEEGTYVAEPVFIPGPGATDEDDGALLSVLYKMTKPRHVTCLLVLDARTMTELGRAQFDVSLSRDIHACFVWS
ncbi:beta,beta-carotene 15,15'-dioxygenase-like [Liolophura sinensis]|uniref:beta,beta-carotene 15,15'-dioxygenase-like n=1 Tax=Liolophura sinensis TaxID=3198878 RepID=UPI003157F840